MRALTILFVLFLAYSFLGWIIDTGFRSVCAGRYISGDGFPLPRWVPLCPIYGVGVFLALAVAPFLHSYPIFLQVFALTVLLAAYEYASAVVSEVVVGRPLWNYQRHRFHLRGRIAPFPSLLWGPLGLFIVRVVHPALLHLLG